MANSVKPVINKSVALSYYSLLVIFLLVLGAALPLAYVFLSPLYEKHYFTLDLFSEKTLIEGFYYTISASIIFLFSAYINRPKEYSKNRNLDFYLKEYKKHNKKIFILGGLAVLVDTSLNLIYGFAPSNLVSIRPGLFFGYISRLFWFCSFITVIYRLILFKNFDKYSLIIIGLLLLHSITSLSRAGFFYITYIVLVGLSYSIDRRNNFSKKYFFILAIIGFITFILANFVRGIQFEYPLFNGLQRFYENNQALYMGIEDFSKLQNIILENEPQILFQQIFSFISTRTDYPSSFRLLEFWGASIDFSAANEHIAGYAYGWLGLSFGMLAWWGLLLILCFYCLIFKFMRSLACNPTLSNVIWFSFFSWLLYESFMNLGLDNFGEKIFKNMASTFFLAIFFKIVSFFKK